MTALWTAVTVDVILLDFDGPTCHLFAGWPAHLVAADLRTYLAGLGVHVPTERANPSDPLALYAAAVALAPDHADEIERWLTEAETTAAGMAEPTPGCRAVLGAARAVRRPLVMVSNNSGAAVRAYLNRECLNNYVSDIIGRPYGFPERMKPAPWSLQEAARRQQVSPSACVLIGDSVTDLQAADSAGARSIGYANKPGKRERFVGATAIVDDMHAVADAIRASERRHHDGHRTFRRT